MTPEHKKIAARLQVIELARIHIKQINWHFQGSSKTYVIPEITKDCAIITALPFITKGFFVTYHEKKRQMHVFTQKPADLEKVLFNFLHSWKYLECFPQQIVRDNQTAKLGAFFRQSKKN